MIQTMMIFLTLMFATGIAGILCLLFGAIGTGLGLLILAYFCSKIAETAAKRS